VTITQDNSNTSFNPQTLESSVASPTSTIRTVFKFSSEQKQVMMDKFNAGLHYPTIAEKDALAQLLGVATESVTSHLYTYSDFTMV
jgi:hypothetical protein